MQILKNKSQGNGRRDRNFRGTDVRQEEKNRIEEKKGTYRIREKDKDEGVTEGKEHREGWKQRRTGEQIVLSK